MKRTWILRAIAMAALALLALSLLIMLLWNWLAPGLFNGKPINLWQAAGLLVLAKILFGSFGQRSWSKNYNVSRQAWKIKFEQKWQQMTPEEKERFKQNFAYRCGTRRQPEENTTK